MLEAKHENLVRVHNIYQLDGTLHLVVDLVDPVDDLAQSDLFEYVITKGALSTVEVCKLLYQTAAAIHYLNTVQNAIHRDLKPENILLGVELFDRIRVTDYGLARIFPEGLSNVDHTATANVGSPGYQAPETISKQSDQTHYGKQVDVWSIGCIIYICCSQVPPFGLGDRCDIKGIQSGSYKPMSGPKWDKVPQDMKDLIGRMLTVNPDTRITVEEILGNAFVKANAGILD